LPENDETRATIRAEDARVCIGAWRFRGNPMRGRPLSLNDLRSAEGAPMKIATAAAFLLCSVGLALAQAQAPNNPSDASAQSTGRTPPEAKGQKQPQGWTGPLDTTTGGAPAESPQGQSPPGMQPAPQGSSKTVVEPSK
jgi:hypothetical protein